MILKQSKIYNTLLAFCSLLIVFSCKPNQNQKVKATSNLPSLFTTLYNSGDLDIIIETDIQSIIDNKAEDGNHYQLMQFTALSNDQKIIEETLKVRPRGITRKEKCDFPPLMIKVPKDTTGTSKLSHSENIKLVTYCKDSTNFEQWVYREYLAYKLYNEISEHSFNVKLANVTYKDSKGAHDDISKIGFIIEPLDELALRHDCEVLEDDEAVKTIHKEKYKLLTMYQYMIGNTDWNFTKRHNVRLLACDAKYGPIPVPYDFDYSGLVNCNYAKPHPMLPITSVRDRLFQWRGSVDEDFSGVSDLFRTKKDSFINICKAGNLPHEDETDIEEYLSGFYASITSQEDIKSEILKARKK